MTTTTSSRQWSGGPLSPPTRSLEDQRPPRKTVFTRKRRKPRQCEQLRHAVVVGRFPSGLIPDSRRCAAHVHTVLAHLHARITPMPCIFTPRLVSSEGEDTKNSGTDPSTPESMSLGSLGFRCSIVRHSRDIDLLFPDQGGAALSPLSRIEDVYLIAQESIGMVMSSIRACLAHGKRGEGGASKSMLAAHGILAKSHPQLTACSHGDQTFLHLTHHVPMIVGD